MNKSHNANIDVLKGLACLCVVYIHSTNIFTYVGESKFAGLHLILSPLLVLANCGVPIFFIVSGYLSQNTLEKYGYKSMMLKKVRTLLIPYIIWNIFYMVIEYAGNLVLPGAFADLTKESVIGLLVTLFGIPFIKPPMYDPLWFIRSLFLIFLISPIINYIVRKVHWMISIVISILLMFFNIPIFYNNGFFVNRSVPFFIIGLLVAMNREKIHIFIVKIHKSVAGVIIVLTLMLTYLDGYIYNLMKQSTNNDLAFVYHILNMITICSMLCAIYILINLKKEDSKIIRLLIYVSEYSFMIYVLHGKIVTILQILSVKLITQNMFLMFFEILIFPVIAVSINIAIAYVCKRYLPKTYSIITGGR